jgi:dipeptidyl aminopeptidase/acylaminoacyl peptidase
LPRSPIAHASRVGTPTLIICGELDLCTPAGQGLEFHKALQRAGATSVFLTYPGEGHGVRQFPAAIDCASRVIDWFHEYMPVDGASARHEA